MRTVHLRGGHYDCGSGPGHWFPRGPRENNDDLRPELLRDRARGAATPAPLRLLGGGVRLPDRHGGRDPAQPALWPLPGPGSPLGAHHHRGLRDLRGQHDRHTATGQLHSGAYRAPGHDARCRRDDDGGSGDSRGVEGPARAADRAAGHRSVGRAGRGHRDHLPHRVAPARGSEGIARPGQDHRHVSDRRRAWRRPADRRLPRAVGDPAADRALPRVHRARGDRADRPAGRAGDGRAGHGEEAGRRDARSGFRSRRQPRPSRPSPRMACSQGCPDSSSAPRCTSPRTHCPVPRCLFFLPAA